MTHICDVFLFTSQFAILAFGFQVAKRPCKIALTGTVEVSFLLGTRGAIFAQVAFTPVNLLLAVSSRCSKNAVTAIAANLVNTSGAVSARIGMTVFVQILAVASRETFGTLTGICIGTILTRTVVKTNTRSGVKKEFLEMF